MTNYFFIYCNEHKQHWAIFFSKIHITQFKLKYHAVTDCFGNFMVQKGKLMIVSLVTININYRFEIVPSRRYLFVN